MDPTAKFINLDTTRRGEVGSVEIRIENSTTGAPPAALVGGMIHQAPRELTVEVSARGNDWVGFIARCIFGGQIASTAMHMAITMKRQSPDGHRRAVSPH